MKVENMNNQPLIEDLKSEILVQQGIIKDFLAEKLMKE
jgi:hypothetical protein